MKEIVRAGSHGICAREGVLAVLGLGSCVAIILYDGGTRVGGLSHVLLPDPTYSTSPQRRKRFATTAIPELVNAMEEAGARKDRMTARLVGGASMFRELTASRPNIGERNASAARATLEADGIPIVGEDVGGAFGRSVYFDVKNGRVRVSSPLRDELNV